MMLEREHRVWAVSRGDANGLPLAPAPGASPINIGTPGRPTALQYFHSGSSHRPLYDRDPNPAFRPSNEAVVILRPTGTEHDETLVVGNERAAIARVPELMSVMRRQLRALAAHAAPIVVALLLVPAAAWAAERPATKIVLLLHAEARLAPGIATTDREIRSALQQSIGPIHFYTESLDASWFPDVRVESAVADVLLQKYGGRRLDLVVPVGPAALRFALSQRERIFPQVPVVFAGGLRPTMADPGPPPGVTGTWLDFDWAANLHLIARLHPDTRRIAFVYGSSAFDRSQSKDFHEAFAAYRDRLELLELTDLSFDVLLQRVAALPAGTVIVFFSFLRDRDGEAFIPVDVLRAMSRVAPVPIYAVSDTLAAAGAVGGHVLSFEALGRNTAALAASALTDGLAGDRVTAEPTNLYMFDARALGRWGLGERQLPRGSIVVHRGVSAWERYRWPLLGGAALAVVEAILIVILLIQRRQRTRARRALAQALSLEQLVSELSTKLAAVSPSEMEAQVQDALLRVASELGFDRASLIELTDDPRQARVTRSAAVSGGRPLSELLAVDRFPWTAAALRRGEVVQWPPRSSIAGAAEEDHASLAALGTEALVSVPLAVGRTVVGALSLAKSSPMPHWPETLIQRSRLLGEVFANVIGRRRAETAVRESEGRFRLMADSAPVMIWMAGVDGGCTYVNRQWLDFTGRRLEDEAGAGWADGVHPDDRESCRHRYRAHVDAREEFVLEYRLRRGDGEYRWVVNRGVPRLASDGAFRGYVGACSDITEIKRAHETMLETVRLRSTIFGSLYGHVAAVDRAAVIVAVNESWSRFREQNGWDTLRPPVGTDYLAACRQDMAAGDGSAEQAEAAIRVVLDGHAPRASCEYVAHSGREERWFEMTVEPFHRPEGGAIVTHIDITRRRRAEAEARREHEQLTHALRVRTLGELAASLAHEINQPLAAILSNAQAARLILAKQAGPNDDVTGALQDIADDAKRAAQVIRRLQALCRKEWTEQQKPVDVNEIIVEVTSLLRAELQPAAVELLLELDRLVPPVFGDTIQLQQVLLNVLVNALEAMVSAAEVPRVLAVRTTHTGQGTVEISVRDSGHGVSDADLERIFEPFRTTKKTGLGMGLSISRSIIQAHGGRMWVTPNDDRGVTVYVELPCEEKEGEP
jgi:two-component system, LuxR family, sensor kinase FixL